jgi:hypothetical protein
MTDDNSGPARTVCSICLMGLLLLASIAELAASPPAAVGAGTESAIPAVVGAEESSIETADPSRFDELVTRIVLDVMPHEIVQDKDWGKTRQIWDGVRIRWEGNRLDTRRRWKTVNHGTWKRYEVRLVDPEQRFAVQVESPQAQPDGRVGFVAQVDAAIDVFGRVAQWERGVRLISLSAEATAVVRLRIDCRVAMKLDPSRLPPDVRFEPEITAAELRLVRFRLHRISQVQGPLVRELGSALRSFIESKIADRQDRMVQRINRRIDKQKGDLRLSLHDLLASRWGDLAAEQLESTDDLPPEPEPE